MQNNERVGRRLVRSFSLLKDECSMKSNKADGKKHGLKVLWNKFKNKTPLNEKTVCLSDSATTLTIEEHAKPIFVKKSMLERHRSEGDLKRLASLLRPWSIKKEVVDYHPLRSEKSPMASTNYGETGNLIYVSEHGKHVMIMQILYPKGLETIAGTLDRLFLKLVDVVNQDESYVDTFILCHFFFISSYDLLKKLMTFFHQKDTSEKQSMEWQKRYKSKVLNVILRWVELQFNDFKDNPSLLTQLNILFDVKSSHIEYENQINRIKQTVEKSQPYIKVVDSSLKSVNCKVHDPVKNTVLSSLCRDSFLKIHPMDIAKQLTVADFAMLKNINFQDYINYECGQEKETCCILSITKQANALTQWVTDKINENTASQMDVVYKMIDVAKICLEWNNFHTAMVITMAIDQSEGVQYLLNNSSKEVTYQQLLKYIDLSHNMSYYRAALNRAYPPCIPFFPLILKDITFLLEGNASNYQQQSGLIHFNKFRQLKETIYSILNFTSRNYTFLK